jgi:hypothetical protein
MKLEEKIKKLKKEHGKEVVAEWRTNNSKLSDWFDVNRFDLSYCDEDDLVMAYFEKEEISITIYLEEPSAEIFCEFSGKNISATIEETIGYDTLIEDLESILKITPSVKTISLAVESFDNVPEKFSELFYSVENAVDQIRSLKVIRDHGIEIIGE